jgi:hypothetical protein
MLLAKTNLMALQLWNSFYVGWKCGHPYISFELQGIFISHIDLISNDIQYENTTISKANKM